MYHCSLLSADQRLKWAQKRTLFELSLGEANGQFADGKKRVAKGGVQ
jgi:hypothetical protein